MVATILKGDIAIQQSIYIIRSFKEMKHLIAENHQILNGNDLLKLTNTVMQNKEDIQNIKNTMAMKSDINQIMEKFVNDDDIKEKIFLDGQVFDAAEAYINIYKQAKRSIYIIDDYINIDTLSLLKKKSKGVDVIIFTRNRSNDRLSKLDVEKFNKQYPRLMLKYTNKIHDRFIVLDYDTDDELFYICGASSKDAGQKICTIIQLYDRDKLHYIIDALLKNTEFILL